MTSNNTKLVEILTKIRNQEGTNSSYGICMQVQHFSREDSSDNNFDVNVYRLMKVTMRKACRGWDYFSGSDTFPIQGNEGCKAESTRDDGKITYYTTNNMYEGSYGIKRKNLVKRMLTLLNEEARKELIKILVGLYDKTHYQSDIGICSNINDGIILNNVDVEKEFKLAIHYLSKLTMQAAVLDWEHYSGSSTYPIKSTKHVDGNTDAEDASIEYDYTVRYWKGKYGARRIELVRRMLEELGHAIN